MVKASAGGGGKGMRIDGVTDGKPAQKAGLQKGDIIMMLGDMPVNGIEDYMVGLGKMDNSTLQSLTIATNATFVMVTKCQVRSKKLKFS